MRILGSMPRLKQSRNGGNDDYENNDDGEGDKNRTTVPGAMEGRNKQPLLRGFHYHHYLFQVKRLS